MNKLPRYITIPIVILLASLNPPGNLNAGVVIYDAFSNNSGFLTGPPRNHIADDLSTIATGNSQIDWQMEQLEAKFVIATGGTYDNLTATVKVWQTYDANATGSVFSNLLSSESFVIGDFTTPNISIETATIDYLGSGKSFSLGDGQNIGIEILWTAAANSDNITTALFANNPITTGTSTNGWYLQQNSDAIFDSSEYLNFANPDGAQYRITATSVPEPAAWQTLLLMLAVFTGLGRRRAICKFSERS